MMLNFLHRCLPQLRNPASIALASLALWGCSSQEALPGVGVVQQALQSPDGLLGFEDPTDWSASGLSLVSSNDHSEGSLSLVVPAQGYTVVESHPFALGALSDPRVEVDLKLPAAQSNPYWFGSLGLHLNAPSVGLNNAYQDQVNLQSSEPGQWSTLEFSLSAETLVKLAAGASDLQVRLVLNVPSGNAPYLFDHLRLGDDTEPDPEDPDDQLPPSQVGELVFPEGYGPADVALLAHDSLRLADRTRVTTPSGTDGLVANLGSDISHLGVEGHVGSLLSSAPVFLAERSQVTGELHFSTGLTKQSDVSVGSEVPQDAFETRAFPLWMPGPAQDYPGVDVQPDTAYGELPPGSYGFLRVKSRASLSLSSGSYEFQELTLEPQATVSLDDSAGPIYIRVADSLTIRGDLLAVEAGADSQLLWLYEGTQTAAIEAPLRGTLVAPSASVKLATLTTGAQHRGAVFAKSIQIDPDVDFIHAPFSWVRPRVEVNTSAVCPGQPVVVRVDTTQAADGTVFYIDGVPGAERVLQFDGNPGNRAVLVSSVLPSGFSDSQIVYVEIADCEQIPELIAPVIGTSTSISQEGRVEFAVNNSEQFGAGAAYFWQFGDGESARTQVPAVDHDYLNSLERDQPIGRFEVSVTVARADGTAASGIATVALWNQYAVNKLRGSLQPPVTGPRALEPQGDDWSVSLTFKNLEDESVSFTRRLVEKQPCDGEGTPESLPEIPLSLTLTAGQEVTHSLTLAGADLGAGYCSVAVYLLGQSVGGLPVTVGRHFDIPSAAVESEVGTELGSILNQAVAAGWIDDGDAVTEDELYRLVREARVSEAELTAASRLSSAASPLAKATAAPVEGARCNQGDVDPNFVCVPSDAWVESTVPNVINARKGDIVLSRSPGPIGKVLAQVDPPQQFDHSGMMTENYTQLVHSFAAISRYVDYPNDGDDDPTDGIQENVLKYGWPGVLTESITDAFRDGFRGVDPGNGEWYRATSFFKKPVKDSIRDPLVYPQVLKPTPGWDQHVRPDGRTVRETLHAVADLAKELKGHYRFGVYSEGKMADDPTKVAPDGVGDVWPDGVGTIPSVCSVLIWKAMKDAGITMNQHHGPGEDVDALTEDGLFFYSESERKAGAKALYRFIYNQGVSALGDLAWAGRLFTDGPDDVASQITNCFASDWCSQAAKDSHRWQSPGAGRTVSPSDLMMWDSPEQGGLFGYVEPLVYRSRLFRPAYEWQSVATAGIGDVQVRVVDASLTPVAGATVILNGATLLSDAAGGALFTDVPTIPHEVRATAIIGGVGVAAQRTVTPIEGSTVVVPLTFPSAAPVDRLVTVVGTHKIIDDEFTWDEIGVYPVLETMRVGPPPLGNDDVFFANCRDEVNVKVDLYAAFNPTADEVTLTAEQDLYEGVICSNDDHDGTQSDSVVVPTGSVGSLISTVRNTDEDTDDLGRLNLSVFVDPFYEVPPESHVINIAGTLRLKDDEWFGGDVIETFDVADSVSLNVNDRYRTWEFSRCIGGEVRGKMTVAFTLQSGGEVTAAASYELFEGIVCNSSEREDSHHADYTFAVGSSQTVDIDLDNNGADEADFDITFEHLRFP